MSIINLSLYPKQIKAIELALRHTNDVLISEGHCNEAIIYQDMIKDVDHINIPDNTISLKLSGGRTQALKCALKVAQNENIMPDICEALIEEITYQANTAMFILNDVTESETKIDDVKQPDIRISKTYDDATRPSIKVSKVMIRHKQLFLEVITSENIQADNIVKTSFSPDGETHYFNILETETAHNSKNKVKIKGLAQECGKSRSLLKHDAFDIRDLLKYNVEIISDPEITYQIRSGY